MRRNRKGVHTERWRHIYGCERYFNARRDTSTDQILATYRIGETAP
jgi:heterotetrameric sarcosine oxidase delta subunit